MKPSNGMIWAQIMGGLMIMESLVLVEVIFFDSEPGALSRNPYLKLYFFATVITCVLQFIGILMVKTGHYKWGGIVQIAASSIHALELEGIIGLIGGFKAYMYPQLLIEEKGTA